LKVKIEVYSDTICPWCYVGLARLQEALAARPALEVELRWLPFELNPDLPPDGEDRKAYMLRRFGDVNRFAAGQQQLQDLGRSLGIDFQFDRVTRAPNTRRSHALIGWAGERGGEVQTRVKQRVLAAHFTEGRDIADPQVLADLAVDCGLERDAALQAICDPRRHAEIEALEAQAQGWGISGVPTFIFDRRYAFSGAQPLPVFLDTLDRVAREGAAGAGAAAASGGAAN
jgi:predicted DsbA family dithiol-disulfide isomerase